MARQVEARTARSGRSNRDRVWRTIKLPAPARPYKPGDERTVTNSPPASCDRRLHLVIPGADTCQLGISSGRSHHSGPKTPPAEAMPRGPEIVERSPDICRFCVSSGTRSKGVGPQLAPHAGNIGRHAPYRQAGRKIFHHRVRRISADALLRFDANRAPWELDPKSFGSSRTTSYRPSRKNTITSFSFALSIQYFRFNISSPSNRL
jgi:hypothetical protein